jgi:diadenosine tetraphosphate (Ap4A) HIT family hydrolase
MLTEHSPFYPVETERILLDTAWAFSFFDKFPVSKGHALVIPRQVSACLYDLPAEAQAGVWDAVRQVREILIGRFRPDGFNIGINDGAPAGQTMMHAHVHLIPRYTGDCKDPRGGIRWIVPAKAAYWRPCDCP